MAEKTVRLNLDWTYTPGPDNTSYGPGWVEVPASVAPALQRFHRPTAAPEPAQPTLDHLASTQDPWQGFPGAAALREAKDESGATVFDSPDDVLVFEGDVQQFDGVGPATAKEIAALQKAAKRKK